MSRVALAALLVLGSAIHAPAQLPATTQIICSNVGGLTSTNGLVGLGNGGVVTTLVALAQATPVNAIEMEPANVVALVWDAAGVNQYDTRTGTFVYSTLTTGGGNLHFGAVDEDAGTIWVIGSGATAGSVYRAARPNGTNTSFLTSVAGASFDAVARIGSSGHWALADNSAAASVYVLARDGTVVNRIRSPGLITGMDWSPWDDRLYATRRGNAGQMGLLEIDPVGGTVTTVGPSGSIANDMYGVEILEQPTHRMLVAEAGTDPQHVFVFDRTNNSVLSIHTGNGVIRPADVELPNGRTFWALNVTEVGSKTPLSVSFGSNFAGHTYQVGLSFGFSPGIPIPGVGRIHLNVDPLLFASLNAGPPTFENFSGILDANGEPNNQPAYTIPFIPALQGVRFYGSAVAVGPTGVSAISNSWGITINGPPE